MDTILAVFLAATMTAGDARAAAAPTGGCAYHVGRAAEQVVLLCADLPGGDAGETAPRPNPPAQFGAEASARTAADRAPATQAPEAD